MIGALSIGSLVWRARALRFLMLFLLGWTGVRALALWTPAMAPPHAAPPLPWVALAAPATGPAMLPKEQVQSIIAVQRAPQLARAGAPSFRAAASQTAAPRDPMASSTSAAGWLTASRHSLRLALLTRLLPATPMGVQRTAFMGGGVSFGQRSMPGLDAAADTRAPIAPPMWIGRDLAGWSGAGWLYARGGGSASTNSAALAQLGGDQAGVRLGYGFGSTGRLRAYARGTVAPGQNGQREAAFGLAYAPLPRVPVDLHIEQRLAPRGKGRTALAVIASGGASAVPLLAGFRLDAYAQAGVVGTRSRDAFVDAAVSVEHDVVGQSGPRLTAGALAAGAAQPGAARLDVGPRLSLRLPDVGKGSRIALDWRHRVAGDARPASGLALTLAADF